MILTEPANDDDTSSAWIRPRDELTYIRKNSKGELLDKALVSAASPLNFAAMISEGTGTFVVVLMSMIIMSKT